MAKSRWYQDRQREPFHRQAKKEGYRARSAYKLQEILDRFHIVRRGDAVADLGCAPGGWSQVLAEAVGPEGFVVGVDLQRVKSVAGVRFIKGDITNPDTHARLAAVLKEAGRELLDAVVSDMAPDMSGAYDLDQARSVHLAEMALAFGARHLRPGGNFCCKVFEGLDFPALRDEVRARFHNVQQIHPTASRRSSSEIYLVAKGFRGGAGSPPAKPAPAEAV